MRVYRCDCGWEVGTSTPWTLADVARVANENVRRAVDHWAAGHRVESPRVVRLAVRAAAIGLMLSGYEPRNLG